MLPEFRPKTSETKVLLNLRPDSTAISLAGRAVYSYDVVGRLLTAWIEDHTFVRTLANQVVHKWWDKGRRGAWKRIQDLDDHEARRFLEQTSALMMDLFRILRGGELTLVPLESLPRREGSNPEAAGGVRLEGTVHFEQRPPATPDSAGQPSFFATGGPPEGIDISQADTQTEAMGQAIQRLATIASWSYHRLENERLAFHSVYKPVTILPPDQYLSVVLQATEGCHWNRCTFCNFYRHTYFHIKSPEEFSQHMEAVKSFFGEAIRLRRTLFLGDANALVIPQEKLVSIFDQVNREFVIAAPSRGLCAEMLPSFRGIYSFIDVFTGVKKSVSDFQELKARNLSRVYLGAETGCNDLLRVLNKPGSSQETFEIIEAIKQAELSVGVIILVGVGGDRYFQAHIDETLDLLNHLNLGEGDILYFSPLWQPATSEYEEPATAGGIRRLTDEELSLQLQTIRQGLKFNTHHKPKVARYDIREFIY